MMCEVTIETFPVSEMFARVETSAERTTEAAPEDLGGVVAVVEDVFVEGGGRAQRVRWVE